MSDNENFDFTEEFSLDDILAEHYITNIEERVINKIKPSEKDESSPAESIPFEIPEIDSIENVLPSNFDEALNDMQSFFRARDKEADSIFDDYPALTTDLNIRAQETDEQPPAIDYVFEPAEEPYVISDDPASLDENPEAPAQENTKSSYESEAAKQKELAENAFFGNDDESEEAPSEPEEIDVHREAENIIRMIESKERENRIKEEPEALNAESEEDFNESGAEISSEKPDIESDSAGKSEKESQAEILLFDDFRRKREETSGVQFVESGMRIPDEKRGLFRKLIKNKEDNPVDNEEEDNESIPAFAGEPEEEYIPEPDYSEAADSIIRKVSAKIIRSRICMIVALVLLVLTVLYERGVNIPFIGEAKLFLIVITALQVITAALAYDVIGRGVSDIFEKIPGAHTVVLFSNIITLLSNAFMLLGVIDISFSFSAVSALSSAFALFGDYRKDTAQLMALKTAAAVSSPYSVTCRYVEEADAKMIMKHNKGTEGFYNDLTKRDFTEKLYALFCPFFILASILLATVASISTKTNFILSLSSLAASSAAFTAFSAYALPFLKVIRALRKSGTTIAGWSGADEINTAHGVRITDEDLFPSGTVVESARAYDGFRLQKVIRYAASIMIAADNGLSAAFSELLESQSIAMERVEDFRLCQDGIMALIRGERILCGTNACMTLYGIKAPQELNSKNTIYIAINGMPAGAITINYKPLEAVQTSLLSMIKSKFTLFFAVRDFNVSPLMVKQRLQIPIDDIECFPVDDIYKISSMAAADVPHTSAVLARYNPKLYADTINAALSLRKVTVVNTIISLITTIAGILLAFFMCLKGTSGAASPTSLAEYMLAMQIITMIISRAVSA